MRAFRPRCLYPRMPPRAGTISAATPLFAARAAGAAAGKPASPKEPAFDFSPENFRRPSLPDGCTVLDVPVATVTDENAAELLEKPGFGCLVEDPADFVAGGGGKQGEKYRFEIVKWPAQGWRSLDPATGDEAGTTEGAFEVQWKGDFFVGRNLAISTVNNVYLDGLGTRTPTLASESGAKSVALNGTEEGSDGSTLYLWMSDYHPDGGQLFFPMCGRGEAPCPFFVCLGPPEHGDDIRPEHMRAFQIPAGRGVYINPGTWHNGIYVHRKRCLNGEPRSFLTRQGRVHARVSCSWAAEFKTLLRVRLEEC